MEFTYENQGTNTYLCCDLTDMGIDSMGLGMITNNRIPGFVLSIFTQIDGRKYIKYNVSSKVSMKQFFARSVNRKCLVDVFAGIVDALLLSEEYMLDIKSIVLDMNYIFINVIDYHAETIYVPALTGNGGNADVAAFFKNIMFTTQFNSSEDCGYVAEIINFLNREGAFSILQFKELLEKLKGQLPDQSQKRTEVMETPSEGLSMGTRELWKVTASPSIPVAEPGPKITPSVLQQKQQNIQGVNEHKIPDAQKRNDASVTGQTQKEISLFYLLQHYNKENADIYKAQKEAKKQKGDKSSGKKTKEKAPGVSVGFAIPGQQKLPAIPAQQVSADAVSSLQPVSPMSVPIPVSVPEPVAPPASVLAAKPSYLPSDGFGETEYFMQDADGDGGTVLLGADNEVQRIQPYLMRLNNNEKIPLDRAVLRIGRNREFADYVIPENRFIGHSHCHILVRNGEYYIVDDNSKNHTYVNGNMIQSNVEVKLSHSALVTVANEEFEFRLF